MGEWIGWLWFAIGESHVSDRLPRPRASKNVIREEMLLQEGGDLFRLNITRARIKNNVQG